MNPPLGMRPLPYRKVVQRLADFGFFPIGQRGSHVKFANKEGRLVVVPHHANRDVSRGTLGEIIEQAGVDPDEFFAAFR